MRLRKRKSLGRYGEDGTTCKLLCEVSRNTPETIVYLQIIYRSLAQPKKPVVVIKLSTLKYEIFCNQSEH